MVENAASLQIHSDGGFGPVVNAYAPPPGVPRVEAVAFGDLNNDGVDDVVLCLGEGRRVHMAGGPNGAGPWAYIGGACHDVELMDFNGDGWLDVVTVGSGATLELSPSLGDGGYGADYDGGTQGPQRLGRSAVHGSLDVMDVTGDGLLDIVTVGTIPPAPTNHVLDVFPRLQGGGWAPAVASATTAFSAVGRPIQRLQDGEQILVGIVSTSAPRTVLLHIDPLGRVTEELLQPEGHAVDVGDADGDGWDDILVRGTGTVVVYQRQAGWVAGTRWDMAGARLMDVDLDGAVDIVGNGWARAIGGGAFQVPVRFPAALGYRGARRTGTDSLALWGTSGLRAATVQGLEILVQAPEFVLPAGQDGRVLLTGNLNGDQALDAVFGWGVDSTSVVFFGSVLGVEAGGFSPGIGPLPSTITDRSALADLNRDGLDDIVRLGFMQLLVLPSNGDGTVGAEFALDLSLFASDFALEDLNGDGATDILTTSGRSMEVFMTGPDGGYTSQLLTPEPGCVPGSCAGGLPLPPRVFGFGDMNGDSLTDVIMGTGGHFLVHLVSPAGGLDPPGPVHTQPFTNDRFDILDSNMDGKLDVMTVGERAQLWLNQGDGTYEPLEPMALPGMLLAIGPYFGPGRRDMLLQEVTSGDLLMLPCSWGAMP